MLFHTEKEIRIAKDNDKYSIHLREDDKSEDFDMNKDTFNTIFENSKPTNGFSTPDSMIQGLLKGTAVIPSFLKNKRYTIHEFNTTILPAKDELKNFIKLNEKMRKNKRRNRTRRVRKKSSDKRILIENLNKRKKKPMKKRQKTSKGKTSKGKTPKGKTPKGKTPKGKTPKK